MTLPEHVQIQGDHQGAASGGGHARQQVTDKTAVPHQVELEPERLGHCGGYVLDRADRHGAQAERDPGRLRRAAGKDLAVTELHAAQPDRSQRQRQRRRLAGDDRGQLARPDINPDALAEPDRVQVGPVGPQRRLRIRAVVGVLEKRPRDPA